MTLRITVLMCALSLIAVGDEPAKTDSDYWEKLTKKREALNTVEAQFTQRTVTPEESVLVVGSLIYAKPDTLIIRFEDPPITYLFDERYVVEFDAETRQTERYETKNAVAAEVLKIGFRSAFDGPVGERRLIATFQAIEQGVRLTLEPKPGQVDSAGFVRAALELREVDYLPTSIHVINSGDSEVFYDLHNIDVNAPVASESLQIYLPEGTTVVHDGEFVETVGAGGTHIQASPSTDVPVTGTPETPAP